ncbi:MAG TPA: FtsX-like permease family protein, partial [Blastocatellia bacterium]
ASLQAEVTKGVKPALLAVFGAVLLVLLIACVNVANLLLARGAQRRGEFATRAALGAGRGRLIRQQLTESLLIAVAGGAVGMLVASLGISALLAISPKDLPRVDAIRLNGAAFAFGFLISTLVGILAGLIPALNASSTSLRAGLQKQSRSMAGGHQVARRTLVVVEVAVALVLLVSAGLLLRSVERVLGVAPGFDSSHLLTMEVQTYGRRYDDDSVCNRFFDQSLDQVRRLPGVTAAAFTTDLPLSGDDANLDVYNVAIESRGDDDAMRYAVSPGYFEAVRLPLRKGRLFDAHDIAGAAVRPVIISDSFANHRFPGEDPIGKRLRLGGNPATRPWDVVVGVVGDVKQASLAASQSDAVYVTTDQWLWADGTRWLVVRTQGDPAGLISDIKREIWSVDKDQPIVRISTMDGLLAASESQRRFVLSLFEAFGIAALLLASMGIYGVMSGTVAERLREIGVRTALGASRGDILAFVLLQGLLLTALGLAIGLAGSFAASRALESLLFGTSRLDAITYAGVVALLTGASVAACWVPACRAVKVDPCTILRAE